MSTTRKDYAATAVLPPSNETLKRVNTMNAPYSVQATGHDKQKENYIPITSSSADAIVVGNRILIGNNEGLVTTVNLTAGSPPLVSIVVNYPAKINGTERNVTYTKQELLDASALFLVNP